jgi:hypothetical protein
MKECVWRKGNTECAVQAEKNNNRKLMLKEEEKEMD